MAVTRLGWRSTSRAAARGAHHLLQLFLRKAASFGAAERGPPLVDADNVHRASLDAGIAFFKAPRLFTAVRLHNCNAVNTSLKRPGHEQYALVVELGQMPDVVDEGLLLGR